MIRNTKAAAKRARYAKAVPRRTTGTAKSLTLAAVRRITDQQTAHLLAALVPPSGTTPSADAAPPQPPKYGSLPIGSSLPGGLFAGITYVDGKPYVLVLGPEYDGELDWNAFSAWLKTLSVDGCTDFVDPSQLDGMILWTNMRSHFKKAVYWLTQHADYSSYAWSQNFTYGNQYNWDKDYKFRGRAVRRFPLTDSTL